MKIIYFASLKENLKISHDLMHFDAPVSIALIKQKLIEKHGSKHFPNNILCAVNQEMALVDTIFKEDDEVAFFPPVTGG